MNKFAEWTTGAVAVTAVFVAGIAVGVHDRQPAASLRAFRCGERMEAIITAQADHAPLTASERACWAEWQGKGR